MEGNVPGHGVRVHTDRVGSLNRNIIRCHSPRTGVRGSVRSITAPLLATGADGDTLAYLSRWYGMMLVRRRAIAAEGYAMDVLNRTSRRRVWGGGTPLLPITIFNAMVRW
jgi:hypothetical protein